MMTTNDEQTGAPTAPASAEQGQRPSAGLAGAIEAIERCAALQLSNRFIWLVAVIWLFLAGYLTLLQWQSEHFWKTEVFDTFQLVSFIMLLLETSLLACLLLVTLSTPQLVKRWYSRYANQPFSYALYGIAAVLSLALVFALLLIPFGALHSYPQMAAEGYSIPLMLLQRGLLVFVAVIISLNIVMLFRAYLRLPWWICGLLGIAWHIGLTFVIAKASFTTEQLRRLNDVFFYNQLWHYIDGFPNLQRPEVFHNMQTPEVPYFTLYLVIGLLVCIVSYLLWLPRAELLSRESLREWQRKQPETC